MRYIYRVALILLPVFMLSLSGCGSSSSGSTADPFSSSSASTGTSTGSGTIFGNISTATGKTGITLTADRSTVDVNNGQVLVTAKIVSNGVAVSGVPVTFSIIAPVNGPATIETGMTIVTTDSNGTAISRITTGNTLSTTNVIVSATAKIGTQSATANTTFQIVRGTGIITFITGKAPSDPDGTLVTLSKTVDASFVDATFEFMQQLPFKVTDSNGNPRVGVDVTLSKYSQLHNYASSTPVPQTIKTDSAGMAIFNVGVTMIGPPINVTRTDSIVYQAVTNDTIPLTAYGGFVVSLTTAVPPLALAPSNLSFAAGDIVEATRTFAISGGVAPYTVNSSNTARVTVSRSDTTLTATLADASLWAEVVTISVLDSLGQTVSATILRQ